MVRKNGNADLEPVEQELIVDEEFLEILEPANAEQQNKDCYHHAHSN